MLVDINELVSFLGSRVTCNQCLLDLKNGGLSEEIQKNG